MGKKIKLSIRSASCPNKNCKCVGVHSEDLLHGQATIETRGVAYPGIARSKLRFSGHDGYTADRGKHATKLGTRKK